jgi:alpha-beta hydrolase superfamily lysophospholipase
MTGTHIAKYKLLFNHMSKKYLLIIAFWFEMISLQGQYLDELPRHANWGASFSASAIGLAGATVRQLVPGGFAEQVGLKQGDIILKVNQIVLNNALQIETVLKTANVIIGGSPVTIEIIRDKKILIKKGTVPPRPKESFDKIITEYKSIMSPYGYRVQVIITRPQNANGKIPGIFLIRWMSCDPIEKPDSRKHGVARMLEDFIQKSGYAVMRVEKPGLGDSQGPPCYDTDFCHELAAHQEAYRVFRQLEFIDSTKIVIFAQSNGAAYAPLVAEAQQPAAYLLSGGWAKTWYEHMLEFKRRNFELSGDKQVEITRKMKLIAELYTDYLIHKRVPGEIVIQKPHLKEVWDAEFDHQWGLPITYMQQLQDLDIPGAWSGVNVPAYVFYGGYDGAMVEEDHKKIVSLINNHGKNVAKYELVPNLSHSLFWFENENDATTKFWEKGVYKEELAYKLMEWMKTILNK